MPFSRHCITGPDYEHDIAVHTDLGHLVPDSVCQFSPEYFFLLPFPYCIFWKKVTYA